MESGLILVLLLCGLGVGVNAGCNKSDDSCKNCPPGWTAYQGLCYLFQEGEAEWAVAERYCNFLDGNLAHILSKEDLHFLRRLIFKGAGSNKRTWVGATDAAKEGGWLWSDGTQFDDNFCCWSPGQPNNKEGNQNCMEINLHGLKTANDVTCSQSNSFICSRKP